MKPARTELPGSIEGRYMDFFPITDLEESVRQDVRRLREHPLIPKNLLLNQLIYLIEGHHKTKTKKKPEKLLGGTGGQKFHGRDADDISL